MFQHRRLAENKRPNASKAEWDARAALRPFSAGRVERNVNSKTTRIYYLLTCPVSKFNCPFGRERVHVYDKLSITMTIFYHNMSSSATESFGC